jgi:cation-transporting ATPase 13A3/4/5
LISPISSPVRATTLGRIASYMGFGHGDNEDEETGRRGRRVSGSRSPRRSFGTSAPSRSRSRSRSRESSEGWGYRESDVDTYSDVSDRASGEEGYTSSLADDTSLPPQSRPGSPTLPLVPNGGDGIFGDSGRGGEFEPKDFPEATIPSRQTILLPDEDLSIRFTGYRTDPFRNFLWWIGCFLTLGALGLLGRWVPSVWVKFCGKEVAFEDAKEGSWLVVEVSSPSEIPFVETGHLLSDPVRRPSHCPFRSHRLPLPPVYCLPAIFTACQRIPSCFNTARSSWTRQSIFPNPLAYHQRRITRRSRRGEGPLA